jgi:hypothetical protein
MIQVSVEQVEETRRELEGFGKDANRLLNTVIRRTAKAYAHFVSDSFLSGQMLGVRSGKTKSSMVAYKTKGEKNSYTIGSMTQSRGTDTMGPAAGSAFNVGAFFIGLANIYEKAGGVDINAKSGGYLTFPVADGKWVSVKSVHLQERPFITASSNQFDFDGRLEAEAEKVIADAIAKRGLG